MAFLLTFLAYTFLPFDIAFGSFDITSFAFIMGSYSYKALVITFKE